MGSAKSLSENTKGSIHGGPVWAFPSPPFRSISWGLFGLVVFPQENHGSFARREEEVIGKIIQKAQRTMKEMLVFSRSVVSDSL